MIFIQRRLLFYCKLQELPIISFSRDINLGTNQALSSAYIALLKEMSKGIDLWVVCPHFCLSSILSDKKLWKELLKIRRPEIVLNVCMQMSTDQFNNSAHCTLLICVPAPLTDKNSYVRKRSQLKFCHFQLGILGMVYLTHKGQRSNFFFEVGGHGRQSPWKKFDIWPLTLMGQINQAQNANLKKANLSWDLFC